MSRLIVKNLPNKMTEKELKTLFGKFGTLTDCSLKYTQNGKSRNFAFIGFSTEEDAQTALNYYNKSYICSVKIMVEFSRDFHSDTRTKKQIPKQEIEIKSEISSPKSTSASVVIIGAPSYINKEHLDDFFCPLIVVCFSKEGRRIIVEFSSKKDAEQGLCRTRNYLGGKKVLIKSPKIEINEKSKRPSRLTIPEIKAEDISESGRLFARNLPFVCTAQDLESTFGEFGKLVEVSLPIDPHTKTPKGFAFITYMFPNDSVKALNHLDGSIFMGRMLHIIPAKSSPENEDTMESMSFKQKKHDKMKKSAGSGHNWNALFLGANAVADALASRFDSSKGDLVGIEASRENNSIGVKMALGETQLVIETRKFLLDHGVALDCFSQASGERSKTVVLVKNLPYGVTNDDVLTLFKPFATVNRVIFPPSAITAIVEFASDATTAFRKLAYSQFRGSPLYLEWAPVELLPHIVKNEHREDDQTDKMTEEKTAVGCTVFVKNLSFITTADTLREVFAACGQVRDVTIAQKISPKEPGKILSSGYGFVSYMNPQSAQNSLRELQRRIVDEHAIELKLSERAPLVSTEREHLQKPTTCCNKLIVRNIPFQARRSEIYKLFCVFGQLKTVRLPQKVSASWTDHRGFAFVDFADEGSARRAMEALCHSTHLYGRRLVIEYASSDSENISRLRRKATDQQTATEGLARSKKRRIIDL